jgi:hypothetical protein
MSDIIEFGEKRKERDLAQEQKDSEECEQLYDDLYAVFDGRNLKNFATVLFVMVGEVATDMGMTPTDATKNLNGDG